ncbi:TPA: hypothetical protein RQL25_004421 [Vibrio vulnificus]|nr:hypothetical protein [Vibrio vulnificus]HDY8159835.1 hypothetical protein [Vibrio vulnificus]HDY8206703.1 hypothetical protein [Vibrio vulnificus]
MEILSFLIAFILAIFSIWLRTRYLLWIEESALKSSLSTELKSELENHGRYLETAKTINDKVSNDEVVVFFSQVPQDYLSSARRLAILDGKNSYKYYEFAVNGCHLNRVASDLSYYLKEVIKHDSGPVKKNYKVAIDKNIQALEDAVKKYSNSALVLLPIVDKNLSNNCPEYKKYSLSLQEQS